MLMPDPPEEPLLNEYLGLLPDIDGPLFGLRAICGNLANDMCQGNMVMRLLFRLCSLSPAEVLTPDADKDSALGDDTH